MAKKSGLGKGLDALFVDNSSGQGNGAVTLRISEIEPNKNQPRKDFDETALAQLADSIAEHGVIQPLLVRPLANGGYQLGCRRAPLAGQQDGGVKRSTCRYSGNDRQ